MKKQRLLVFLALICIVALMLPLAVSAAEIPDNGWVQNEDKSWSFRRDGQWVMNEVIKYGDKYYGFDEAGIMYTNVQFYWNDKYYSAKADGTLRVNEWQQVDGQWYYYAAEGKSAYDFLQLGGKWYFFVEDGRMATDELVWSNDSNGYFAIDKAGTGWQRLGKGWTAAFGNWYFLYEHEEYGLTPAYNEFVEYGGKVYYFDYQGKMVANNIVWDGEYNYLATADGSLLENGWAKVGGKWYYAVEFQLTQWGIHNIGGNWYYFDGITMYDIPGEYYIDYGEYYITPSGVLLHNQWRNDTTGNPDEVGWAYYGDDCVRVRGQVVTIGGTTYYFNHNGVMETNSVHRGAGGVYVFDKDGKGTVVNGWFQHPGTKQWMYAQDGYLVTGIKTIGAATYAFDGEGYMVTESTYYYSGFYYLFDADGKLVTKTGFVKANGSWYYVNNTDGQLYEGWKEAGGKWYYLTPAMRANTVFYDYENDIYYAADNNGVCTQLSGSGWRQLSWGRVYLVNGRPIIDDWKLIGSDWYYFDAYGDMATNDVWRIDGKLYLFDVDGKMFKNGWYKLWGADFYVDANGVVVTDLQTIGGKQYLFSSEWGELCTNGVYYYEDQYYWINADGTIRAIVKEGWNQISGKWYYMRDGEMLQNKLLWEGDICYGFGSDYAMCTNGIKYAWYDYYMFDANGKLLTGWQKFDGKWYYADPYSEDPYIFDEGVYYIDGYEYLFKDGCLFIGTTTMYGTYVSTDSNGVIVEWQELVEGWNYTGDGYVYIKNGSANITGWVGDYYVVDGWMLANTELEYGGKYYYLGADGRYIRSGWYKLPYGDYIYANKDGTLKCSEWLLLGKKYYYFYDIHMVHDAVVYIDGQYHEFNADGVWVGQVNESDPDADTRSDGWHKLGGKWYYYHAGVRQYGNRYIGGNWYFFSYEDGAMVTNGFGDSYYYGSSGARAAYTGWKKIGGYWIYFDADYSMHSGWLKSGNGWYYTEYIYDEDLDTEIYAMIANQAILSDGKLYIFNGSGYCAGPATGTGWRSCGSNWYYVINGSVVADTFYQIGNDTYYFYSDGVMATNTVSSGRTVAGSGMMYYGADGRAVKTAGWKQVQGYWIYIGTNGFLYTNGIYRIGGRDYSFYDCIWVQ